jgi:hypothetical protein
LTSKRIQTGNYFAGKASIANTIAGVYLQKDDELDYTTEIMKQFLDAHKYIKLAQEVNPEWDLYKYGQVSTKENIKMLLLDNKDKWENILNEFDNDSILTKLIKEIGMNQKIDADENQQIDIFLSYSWKNETIADTLDSLFGTKNLKLIRDKRAITYKQSIKDFMKRVRQSDYCLMIISDYYLKSSNCMYEVLEFIKDENYKERILPLIHKDLDIFNIHGRAKYIKYWQKECEQMTKHLLEVEDLNQTTIIEESRKLENIKRNIGEFLSIISDMKNIVFDKNISMVDFDEIYFSIYPDKKPENIYESQEGYFILNVPRTMAEENVLWWEKNNGEYTREIQKAKIFKEEEMLSIINEINGDRKFAAIPINSFVTQLGQNRIPWDFHFQEIFAKNRDHIIGNMDIYLDSEEIAILI